MQSTILKEAEQIVYGDREMTYDDPNANFRRIAGIWTQILGIPVSMEQVSLCMIGVKLARLAHQPTHRDSLVDVVGYAACMERVLDAKETT